MEMTLKVLTPIGVALDALVKQVDFEAPDGFFTLLPKHVDFVSTLKVGVLRYVKSDDKEGYIACNQGVIVKKGGTVSLTTKLAVLDDSLAHLTQAIEQDFKEMEQQRKEANATMAKLEIGLTKNILALSKKGDADVLL